MSDPAWPEGCALRYRVEIGDRLRLVLEVDNHGPGPVVFENVLHTYLAVDDVGAVSVTGLEGAAFVDEADGSARKREGSAPLRVRGETVRIYDHRDAPCVVEDPGGRRRLEVTKTGSASTVVWNPGAERARALPDLGDDEWPDFVCVESGNVGSGGAVHLAPGAGHRLDVSVRALPWERCLRRGFLPGVPPSGILLQSVRDHARGREVEAAATPGRARVAELADALDLGSSGRNPLGVQLPPLAPHLP